MEKHRRKSTIKYRTLKVNRDNIMDCRTVFAYFACRLNENSGAKANWVFFRVVGAWCLPLIRDVFVFARVGVFSFHVLRVFSGCA